MQLVAAERAAVEDLAIGALDVTDVKVDSVGGFVYYTATKRGGIVLATPIVVRLPYQIFLQACAATTQKVYGDTIAAAAMNASIRG